MNNSVRWNESDIRECQTHVTSENVKHMWLQSHGGQSKLVIDRNRNLYRNRNTEISVGSEPIPIPKPKPKPKPTLNRKTEHTETDFEPKFRPKPKDAIIPKLKCKPKPKFRPKPKVSDHWFEVINFTQTNYRITK